MSEAQVHSSEKTESRFFVRTDPRVERLVVPIPTDWWSRFYEYEWARGFCRPEDVALDAGCGLGHPFKFHLADTGAETHACDIDEMMTHPGEVLCGVERDFGMPSGSMGKYLDKINWAKASITDLPYPDGKFDRVYCLSVLEHLNAADVAVALQEFARTVKAGGLVVLTCDYPTLNLPLLERMAQAAGLRFAGSVSSQLPADAIYSPRWHLHCFRALLRREP